MNMPKNALQKFESKKPVRKAGAGDKYGQLFGALVKIVELARHAVVRSVNNVMTSTYWQIGRHIVEHEQIGRRRAGYGEELLSRFSADMTARFGRGFSKSNLSDMRRFFQIFQTPSGKFKKPTVLAELAGRFPLSWSHYVRLMQVENSYARDF